MAMNADEAATLRAALNEELGFYPANLDDESVAEYRRKDAEDREWRARYLRKYGPGGSHVNQFRHLAVKKAQEEREAAARASVADLYR